MSEAPKKNKIIVFAAIGFVGLVLLGILSLLFPNTMEYQAKRSELPANIDGIRVSMIAYHDAFNQFIVQSTPVPRDPAQLNGEVAAWPSGSSFDTLGWAPLIEVRGTYWIEAKGEDDFIIHGMCDLDADGTAAHYTATRSSNAVMVSDADVY